MDSVSEPDDSAVQEMDAEQEAEKATKKAKTKAANDHLDEISRPTGDWPCDKPKCNCGMTFPMKTHQEMHRSGSCWLCGKGFEGKRRTNERKKHERSHVGPEYEDPFKHKRTRCTCDWLITYEEDRNRHCAKNLCVKPITPGEGLRFAAPYGGPPPAASCHRGESTLSVLLPRILVLDSHGGCTTKPTVSLGN